MTVKLIDCHSGISAEYANTQAAIEAAQRLTLNAAGADWEIHDRHGECVACKRPGQTLFSHQRQHKPWRIFLNGRFAYVLYARDKETALANAAGRIDAVKLRTTAIHVYPAQSASD